MQNSRRLILHFGLAAFAALALLPRPAAAQTPAVGFTPNAYGVTDNASDTGVASYSLGFFNDPSFDPNNPFGTVSLSPEPSGTYSYASSH